MRRQVKAKHVRRELLPDQSPELLGALHLLTRDGRLNADALRKLKQVNHLVGLITPALDDLWARFANPIVVDAGSGNAYLAFVLYELFFKPSDKGELWCVESRPELMARAAARAKSLGYTRMRFVESTIAAAELPPRVNLLVALHACDTATDDALVRAVETSCDHVAVVPCCQAEVARQLAEPAERSPIIATLVEHPIHRRELGSHLTNVARALALEARGFKVTVTELTGWEHSLKNELILGKRVRGFDRQARARLESLVAEAAISPSALRLLTAGPAPSGPEAGQ